FERYLSRRPRRSRFERRRARVRMPRAGAETPAAEPEGEGQSERQGAAASRARRRRGARGGARGDRFLVEVATRGGASRQRGGGVGLDDRRAAGDGERLREESVEARRRRVDVPVVVLAGATAGDDPDDRARVRADRRSAGVALADGLADLELVRSEGRP